MEDNALKSCNSKRFSSVSYASDLSGFGLSEDDPISAYFKKRCETSVKSFLKKNRESDSDSSLGLIDVDNLSLFGDDEEKENGEPELRNSFLTFDKSNCQRESYGSMNSFNEQSRNSLDPESHLRKQRALAHKALMNFDKIDESQCEYSFAQSDKTIENSVEVDQTKDVGPLGKGIDKPWFQPNFSPNTPRYFNDELSSFGGENHTINKTDVRRNLSMRGSQINEKKNRQSKSDKKLSLVLKELGQLELNDEMEFKTQSKEEQICKLEEDEKQFNLENSGLLHNSCISQFSGIAGGDLNIWSPTSNLRKSTLETKNLSIGQFFNMRSNRVSSLVGFDGGRDNLAVSPGSKDGYHGSILHEQSLPVSNVSKMDSLKPRRCLSTYDLKPGGEPSRFSSDSTTSNSTVMIQNIIAEMESGLSGTQIYEKLIKAYGAKKLPQNEQNSPLIDASQPRGNEETPKSSKVPKRKENADKNENVRDQPKNFRQILEIERSTSSLENEFKENQPVRDVDDFGSDQSISILRNEKIKQLKGKKGFDASTPKIQHVRILDEKFKAGCTSVEKDEWEVPKISFIQPTVDMNKTGVSEENDKTLTLHSNSTIMGPESVKKNNSTIMINNTRTVEDTITAGDLTILSQRIDEMKEDGVCIVRSKNADEPILLTVVQKLADLPKGSVDCSSLTPLIRDQFPELLSNFPTPSSDRTVVNKTYFTPPCDRTKNILVSEPGCWVKLPKRLGFSEKLIAFVEVKKTIFIPVSNTSKNWLLVSVDSVVINHPSGGRLQGVKRDEEWNICDFVSIQMKDVIIPPGCQQTLQVMFSSKVASKIDWKITLFLKQFLGNDVQTRDILIRTQNVNPLNSLNVIPKDSINFGVIADQCFDERTFQITFDGISELPLVVYIDEMECQSPHFLLKPLIPVVGDNKGDWINDKFHITLREGEKQLLEFTVYFQPNALLSGASKIQDFKAKLIVKIDNDTDSDGILQSIPIKGSVSFAKFFWNASCSPFVFRVSDKGQSLTRSFPLKNVGNMPIAFSVKIENENTERDDIFMAPKAFYLSRYEESAIDITFNANTKENCVKSVMSLQIKPNGRAKYDVELIGIINSMEVSRPLSRTSSVSVSTKSLSNTESVPVKLLTTTNSLSWTSVPLEKELRQSFQLKNASSLTVTVRITFKSNSGSFKLVNEIGEKVLKIRKVLKPDCPFNLTVAFKPDSVGPHHNALFIETNQITGKKMILLNGIGGMPNLFIGNIKSDLNGYKMIVLHNVQTSSNQIYSNTLEFKNGGRLPGFILIKTNIEAITLSHELVVSPPCCIIPPDSKIVVKLSQKLKNDDLRQLLSGKDINKVATLSVIMGDEPSRLRLRKLVESGKILSSERSKILTAHFDGEKDMNLNAFEDSASFENQFLKSLRVVEVAVVVERSSGVCEPTILVDEDETIDEFVTMCSAMDSTLKSSINVTLDNPSGKQSQKSKNKSPDSNITPFSIEMNSSHQKIAKWLETLEYPTKKL